MTVGLVSASGAVLMMLVIRLLEFAGAPAAVAWAPWYVPTVAAVLWTTRRPKPASVDDGDESWVIHSLRTALVGVDTPRPTRVRVTAALALGAPIAWSFVIIGVLALVGVI